ncbi:MAG TPA: S46 family peptidase [Pyrinomonadaceae bacterium]
MRSGKYLCALAALALLIIPTLRLRARADEGMWPFNNVPKEELKRRYGFVVTDAWLRKVQLSSVRFNNGGSGSFVSADGLVLTNHHIAEDTLGKLSSGEKDYMRDGFLARTRAEEAKAPDLELNLLVSIEDVTERINRAVKPGMSAAEANAARDSELKAIEDESNKATGLRSDVVTLYQGGQYNLYRYKKYTDVRLVFAPEAAIGFFGGDTDNFEYPRYNLDMALFRVYEGGRPLKVENYFAWSKQGARENELVFISGNPGSTGRLDTVAHLEFLRDVGLPFQLKWYNNRLAALRKYGAQGEEQARRAEPEVLSIENALKLWRGQQEGLSDKSIMAKKVKEEEALRRLIASDPKKREMYADAWAAVARARKALASYERERRFLESTTGYRTAGFQSTLFDLARKLVRLAEENTKPNEERLPDFTDASRETLELSLYSPAPIYNDFEKAKLAASLAFMRDELGANNPLVRKALGGKSPEARAAELVDGTKLRDVEYRRQLAAGGVKAISDSTDPMIVLARSVDADARAVRKRYVDEVEGVERDSYAKISRALFEINGTKMYPDATFTLRLAFGPIKGYEENGKRIPAFVDFGGLYRRAAEHNNQIPFRLPERWLDKKSALDLKMPFNFVAALDSTGGNSGSPVINRDAQIVGLLFDGNIQSLIGDYVYDETQNRSVCVDSRAMIEALRKVYGAGEVADELTR